jgi:hypothetical protein
VSSGGLRGELLVTLLFNPMRKLPATSTALVTSMTTTTLLELCLNGGFENAASQHGADSTVSLGRSRRQRAFRAIAAPTRQSMRVRCSEPKALEKLAKTNTPYFTTFFPMELKA